MPPDFPLQVVLDYRHNRVQLMEIELGRLQALYQAQQARLAKLRDSREQLFAELRERQNGEVEMAVVALLRLNIRGVERGIETEQTTLAELSLKVMEQQQKVIAARQDEETLETLKENAQVRFRAGQARREERQRDDIYIAQAHRRAAQVAGGLL